MSPVKEREGARLSFSSAAARLPYAVGTLLILVVPLFLAPYIQGLMGKVLIYGIFAMSLNLIYGYTGLLSLGHAAYLGLGSYTVSILFLHLGVKSFWIAAPAGIIVASLAAAVFGLIALRVSGLYFLMITFALGELLVSVAVRWYRVTGGAF